METSIPAAIVAAILMVSVVLLARTGFRSFDDMGQVWKEMEVRASEQAHTELTVTNVNDLSGPVWQVDLRNDGSTRLAEYGRMDLVVQYTRSGGAQEVDWIPYTDGSLADNTWVVYSITNDSFEPGLVNPGETLVVQFRLNPEAAEGSTNRFFFSSELGVTVSSAFTE